MNNSVKLDILVPLYNEEQSIDFFWQNLFHEIKNIDSKYKVSVIFLNNASNDLTFLKLSELKKKHEFIEIITYTRNIGYQNSLMAGLSYSNADINIILDGDGEDPPNLISDFIQGYEAGYEVVYGNRKDREENFIKSYLRRVFYFLISKTADVEVVPNMAEFSLISRDCRNFIVACTKNNTFPFLRAEIARFSTNRLSIKYKRKKRYFGKSNYNYFGSLKFAISAFLTTSTLPLRISAPIGLIVIVMSIFGAFFDHMLYSIMLLLCYLVFILTILSLYIARLYVNQLNRPRFQINYDKTTLRINQ